MTELRETVVDAAARACPFASRDMLRRALKAAAPLIAADAFTDGFTDGVATERQNIIELATKVGAVYTTLDGQGYAYDGALFADLLTEGDTT